MCNNSTVREIRVGDRVEIIRVAPKRERRRYVREVTWVQNVESQDCVLILGTESLVRIRRGADGVWQDDESAGTITRRYTIGGFRIP